MIAELRLHFPETPEIIFPICLGRRNKIRGRQFAPGEKSLPVALSVQIVAMGVVGRSHAVRTHFLNQRNRLAFVFA